MSPLRAAAGATAGAVLGSIVAYGLALVIMWTNQGSLAVKESGDVAFWTLLGSFFGLQPAQAVTVFVRIVYVALTGSAAALALSGAWKPPNGRDEFDRMIFVPALIAGMTGALLGILALPVLTIYMAPDVVGWMASRTFPLDWIVIGGMLALAGLGALAGATLGRMVSGFVDRIADASR